MQKSTLETLFKVSIYVFVSVGLSEVDPEEHKGRRLSQIGGVSYKEIDFTLLIPMPEVDKKHVLVTKHRYLK